MVMLLTFLLATSCVLTAFARERPLKDKKCIFVKVKTQSVNGKALWETKEDLDTSQRDCNEFCANVSFNATGNAHNDMRSATCFKNDGKTSPYVDDQGHNQSDSMPVGTVVYGAGQCVCDDPMLNDFVMDFITEALPAIGEISCKVWYTAMDALQEMAFTAISVLPLGRVGAAAVGLASQAAEVMTWTFPDRGTAEKHYGDWARNPSGNDSEPSVGNEQASMMDAVCGNKHTPPDAEKIFNTMQDAFGLASDLTSAPKLFKGAARSWPPPFARGSENLDDALDFIRDLSNGPATGN